jgi:hypothetical protein
MQGLLVVTSKLCTNSCTCLIIEHGLFSPEKYVIHDTSVMHELRYKVSGVQKIPPNYNVHK